MTTWIQCLDIMREHIRRMIEQESSPEAIKQIFSTCVEQMLDDGVCVEQQLVHEWKCEECGVAFDIDVDVIAGDSNHIGEYHLDCLDKVLERERTDRILYEEDPLGWNSMHVAAQGNIITAIKQLRRLGFTDRDVRDLLNLELRRGME